MSDENGGRAAPGGAGPDPVVAALLATAAWELWPRPGAAPDPSSVPPERSWRFSGRWWARPLPLRRARPSGR